MHRHRTFLSYVYLYGGIVILALLVIALSLRLSMTSLSLSLWSWGQKMATTKAYDDATLGYQLRYPTSLYLQEKYQGPSEYLELSGVKDPSVDMLVLPQQTETYLRGHLGLTGTISASEDYFQSKAVTPSNQYLGSVSVQGRIGYVLMHGTDLKEKAVLFKNANGTWFVMVTQLPKGSNAVYVEPFDSVVKSLSFSK